MKQYLGAIVAFILFLVTGLVPSLVYGGYMGLILSNILFGSVSIWVSRFMVGGGMILGFVAVMFLYLVIGSVINYLVWRMLPKEKSYVSLT